VRHHLDRFEGLGIYDRRQAALHELGESAKDWEPMDDLAEVLRIAMAAEIEPVELCDIEIDYFMRFLRALEDPISRHDRLGVPVRVPSDLPLDPISDPS